MTPPNYHLDRTSAQSFDSASVQYDQYRPSPPQALVDELVALRSVDVLDVACGTGKVAAALVGSEMRVIGVEIDERMANLARGHGVPVEVAEFESWDANGRRFDLITCSDAWHWIDPVRGSEKAATLLRPGGTLALFWSYYLLDDNVAQLFQRVYDQHAPQARTHSYVPRQAQGAPFEPISAFGPIETRRYRWDTTFSATDWVGLLTTFSDHRALTPQQLQTVQAALLETMEDLGGDVAVSRGVHAAFAQRL